MRMDRCSKEQTTVTEKPTGAFRDYESAARKQMHLVTLKDSLVSATPSPRGLVVLRADTISLIMI